MFLKLHYLANFYCVTAKCLNFIGALLDVPNSSAGDVWIHDAIAEDGGVKHKEGGGLAAPDDA